MAESAKLYKRCAAQKPYVHQKIWVERTFFDTPKNPQKPYVHQKIWVERTFFDTPKNPYSASLPPELDKFEGTITKIIDEDTGRVEVRWDFDNAITNNHH